MSKGWKILLVDDDWEDRAIIADALEMLSTEGSLYVAENGEQALTTLHNSLQASSLPCLVVLDLNMPKMNGTETLAHIKQNKQLAHIPVIIYSTSVNPLEKEKCMQLGAYAYMTKPLSFEECQITAQKLLSICETT